MRMYCLKCHCELDIGEVVLCVECLEEENVIIDDNEPLIDIENCPLNPRGVP